MKIPNTFNPEKYFAPSPPPDFDPERYFTLESESVESIPETDWIPAAGHDAPPVADGEDWREFPEEAGSINVPRATMPQIKSAHRGAMVQFLKGRGITHEQVEVDPRTLKPSQAEYSPSKIEKARSFKGPQRSILVSSDGHVLDGHHQWLDTLTASPYKPIPAIRFNAPIKELLIEAARFPSSGVDEKSPPVQRSEDITGGQAQLGEPPVMPAGIRARTPKVTSRAVEDADFSDMEARPAVTGESRYRIPVQLRQRKRRASRLTSWRAVPSFNSPKRTASLTSSEIIG